MKIPLFGRSTMARFALLMLVAVAQVMPPDGAPLPLK
jgi:hypothetical protein